jgi:hypothetical protein
MKNIQSCLSQYKELDDSKLPDNDTRVLGDVLARWQVFIILVIFIYSLLIFHSKGLKDLIQELKKY